MTPKEEYCYNCGDFQESKEAALYLSESTTDHLLSSSKTMIQGMINTAHSTLTHRTRERQPLKWNETSAASLKETD